MRAFAFALSFSFRFASVFAMVSYYNTLTSMFPSHHAAQPHHAVAAARHYFQGYHGAPYGYPQHPQQFHASATTAASPTATAHYPATTADLNSNLCPNGSGPGSGGSAQSAGHFGTHGDAYPAHPPSASPTGWPTAQNGWQVASPFWPPSHCQGPDATLPADGAAVPSSTVGPGGGSPDTPPRGSGDGPGLRGPPAASPDFAGGSDSSGSPRVTPAPGGVGSSYSGDFGDYGSYGGRHGGGRRGDSPLYKDDGSGLPPSPLSPGPGCPASRPQPARSPFEWMKKPSYQSQPDKSGKDLFLRA